MHECFVTAPSSLLSVSREGVCRSFPPYHVRNPRSPHHQPRMDASFSHLTMPFVLVVPSVHVASSNFAHTRGTSSSTLRGNRPVVGRALRIRREYSQGPRPRARPTRRVLVERAGAHLADAGALQRAMADVDVKEMAEVLYPRKQKVSLWIDLAKKRLEGCVANPAPRLRYWRRLREAPMDHSRRLT